MAAVYRVIDRRNDHTIALKILHAHLAEHDVIVQRFEREVRLAQRLRHHHIIPVLEAGTYGHQPYLTMPFARGGSLADHFANPRDVTLEQTAQLLDPIAQALDYAHGQGVFHRDLKLANILLLDQGHIVLSDFGIARAIDETKLTATGMMPGTPLYMAPELAKGRSGDHRADIYALGVMTYLLAVGLFPFTAPEPLALLQLHVNQTPATPTDINDNLPRELNPVLLKALAKDPKERYQTAGELVLDFQQALLKSRGYQIAATVNVRGDGASMIIRQPTRRLTTWLGHPRRRRLALASILVLVVPLLLLLALTQLGSDEDKSPTDTTAGAAVPASPTPSLVPTTPAPTSTTFQVSIEDLNRTATALAQTTARITSGSGAVIRSGPDTRHAALVQAATNANYPIIAYAEGDERWYLVELPDGSAGWLPASAVTVETGDPAMIAQAATVPPLPPSPTPTVACGDGTCNGVETGDTCPQDCAIVQNPPTDFCTGGVVWQWRKSVFDDINPPACTDGTYSFNGSAGLDWAQVLSLHQSAQLNDQIEIVFTPDAAVTIEYFAANTDTLRPGECVELAWEVNGAESVMLQHLSTSGSSADIVEPRAVVSKCPLDDATMYVLVAQRGSERISHTIEIYVDPRN